MKSIKLLTAAFALVAVYLPVARAQEGPETVTLFKNVKVFNGTENKLHDVDVLVVRNRIHKVAKDIPTSGSWEIDVNTGGPKRLSNPLGGADTYSFTTTEEGKTEKKEVKVNVIDGGGKTLMPGMIDSHVHLNLSMGGGRIGMENSSWDYIAAMGAASALEFFADGFTTLRDMGGTHDGLRKVIDDGLLDGPRLYLSGPTISQTSGHGDVLLAGQVDQSENNLGRLGIFLLADGPEECRLAARKAFSKGSTIIKIMMGGGIAGAKSPMFASQYTDAEVTAFVEEAASRDVYVAAHIYTDAEIKRAIRLGVKTIEHGQFISEETAEELKAKGCFISPYLASIASDEIFKHPVFGNKNSFEYPRVVEMKEGTKDFISIMKKVKPKIVFSSDIVNGSGVDSRRQRDFEKWVFAENFGNFETLKALTSVGGELAMLSGRSNPYPHKLGVIEEGAYADILIVDGNPLEDITVIGGNKEWFTAPEREKGLEPIQVIMKDGKIFKNTLK